MKKPLIALLFAAALVAAPAPAQSGTLDQVSPFASEVVSGGASYNFDAVSLTWQAETLAGLTGTLEGFQLEIVSGAVGSTVDLAILLGNAWQTSAPVWTGTYTKVTSGTEIAWLDTTSAGIHLNSGDVYVIQIHGTGTGMWGSGTFESPVNTHYGPPLYLNANIFNPEWRIGFHTWMLPDPGIRLTHTGGQCGGTMDFLVSGATPFGAVAYIRAFGLGSFVIPGGPCAGTALGLDSSATLALLTSADFNGDAPVSAPVPQGACGVVYVQALDVSTCATSNTLLIQ